MRGGKPRNRPGICRRPLTFDNNTVRDAFVAGLWQGGGTYEWANYNACLLASVSGRIYHVDPSGYHVSDITLPNDQNPANITRAYFEQGEMFTFIQDGQSQPLIFGGATLRRADRRKGEIPTGTIMKYAMGRMIVVLPDQHSFVAGNIVGSPTGGGSANYNFRDSIIFFTENDLILGGGVFSGVEEITDFQEISAIDRQINLDPLFIFTKTGGNLADLPRVREAWAIMQDPLIVGGLRGEGPIGHLSTITANSDIWYRAVDGTIRSIKMAVRDFQGWGDTPMSQEVHYILKHDTPSLLPFGSGVYFDNRLLMTCSPRKVPDHGIAHEGLIAMDFHEVSSLERRGYPAYDGLWTGVRILQIMTLRVDNAKRCFAFGLDEDDQIGLWEYTKADPFDNFGSPNPQRIPWVLEYPRYNWGEYEARHKRLKRLVGGAVFPSGLVGTVNFTVRYRADNDPIYRQHYTWSDCAEAQCPANACDAMVPNVPQYRGRVTLPLPAIIENTQTQYPSNVGYSFQPRLEVTGPAMIESFKFDATDQPEILFKCAPTERCETLQACNEAVFGHQVE